MRLLIQRAAHASVTIDGAVKSSIGSGLLVFAGFCEGDDEALIDPMVQKLTGLRIFEDDWGKMNLSVKDTGGEILAVSQFTLYADCRKGRRPSFTNAMPPDRAKELYKLFIRALAQAMGAEPATGEFGADMKIELLNDGPVTIMLDSDEIVRR